MADGQATDCGRNHYIAGWKARRQLAAEALSKLGILQHLSALQILIRMETAGEAKMSLEIRSGFPENLHDGFRHEFKYSKPPRVPGRFAAPALPLHARLRKA